MAKVIRTPREIQPTSYALYNAPIGGHTNVLVRRKIGEPCDTLHPSSRDTLLQRNRFTKASMDWAALSYRQQQWWRSQWEYTPDGKLLSGQQLYTAKSIHAQMMSESVESPEFIPPTTTISPCVAARLPDDREIYAYELGLRPAGYVYYWKKAKELARSNWLFENMPEEFQESWLGGGAFFYSPFEFKVLKTRNELARIHTMRFALISGFSIITEDYIPPGYEYFLLLPHTGVLKWAKDKFYANVDTKFYGRVEISYKVTLIDGLPEHYYLHHEHQNLTTFRWFPGKGDFNEQFRCRKDMYGVHHIQFCQTNITPV